METLRSLSVGLEQIAEVLAAIVQKHKDYMVRRGAIELLGQIKVKKAVRVLISVLNDSSLDMRKAAIKSLGKIGDKKALGSLISRFLKDSSEDTRQAIIESIEKMNASREQIIECYLEEMEKSNPYIRMFIEETLKISIESGDKMPRNNKELLEKLEVDGNRIVKENLLKAKEKLLVVEMPLVLCLIESLRVNNKPTDVMIGQSLPMVLDAIKRNVLEEKREEAMRLVIDVGCNLIGFNILPCSTLQYGVPLAMQLSGGNLDKFKENLKSLEKLA